MTFKALIAALLLSATALAASAETITLGVDACGLSRTCYDVPNDAGAVISLYAPFNGFPSLLIDGKMYRALNGTQLASFDSLPLTADDGDVVLLSATFVTYRRMVNSGRAHYWVTTWGLTGGTVTR